MKKKSKQQYIEPKITRIVLDPAQAVMQQCAIGGVYFDNGSYCRIAGTSPGGTQYTTSCGTSIKGAAVFSGLLTYVGTPLHTQPS